MSRPRPTDHEILELAARYYRRPGARDRAAADELGLSSVAFAARLLAILESPSLEVAEAHGPTIARLGRGLDVERSRRVARRSA